MRPAVTLVLALLLAAILGAAVYQFAIADGPTLSSVRSSSTTAPTTTLSAPPSDTVAADS